MSMFQRRAFFFFLKLEIITSCTVKVQFPKSWTTSEVTECSIAVIIGVNTAQSAPPGKTPHLLRYLAPLRRTDPRTSQGFFSLPLFQPSPSLLRTLLFTKPHARVQLASPATFTTARDRCPASNRSPVEQSPRASRGCSGRRASDRLPILPPRPDPRGRRRGGWWVRRSHIPRPFADSPVSRVTPGDGRGAVGL